MAFKYINPGYAELLSVRGGTTVTGEQYSKTGVSFWMPKIRGIAVPYTLTELYGKFDVYLKSGKSLDSTAWLQFGEKNRVKISGYRDYWNVYGTNSDTSYFDAKKRMKHDDVNTIWFHMKQGLNYDAMLHVIVNGHEIGKRTNLYMDFRDAKEISIYAETDDALLSNIILSDEDINMKEQAVLLSVQSTVTDMTDGGDGSYRATAVGQQILQTMDTAALAEAYGADSQVTGVTLFGAPAYRTGTGICTLTSLEEANGAVTEHGRHELTDKTTALVWDGHGASFNMAEMEARQFGWKAGE